MNRLPRSVRSLARNTVLLLMGGLAAKGLLVVGTVVLARRLGVSGFGGYAVLASMVSLANVATTFGTDMVLVREIAAGGRPGAWRPVLIVQLVLSTAAVALAWVIAGALPWPAADGAAALRIYALALLPLAATSTATAVLRGAGAMGRYATAGALGAAVQVVALVLLVGAGASLMDVAWILLGVQAAAAAIAWGIAAATVPDLRRVRGAGAGIAPALAMARTSIPIGVLGLLGMLYQRAPVLVLAALAGPVGTGLFAASVRVTEGAKTAHVALSSAAFPVMAAAAGRHAGGDAAAEIQPPYRAAPAQARPGHREASADARPSDRGAAAEALRWSWRASLAAAIAIAAVLVSVGNAVIGLLYGPEFAPAAPALAILAVAIVPSTAGAWRSLVLLAGHREPVVLRALLAGLGLLAVLLVTLVPVAGWIGACWAVLVAEAGQLAILVVADGTPALPMGRVIPRRRVVLLDGDAVR